MAPPTVYCMSVNTAKTTPHRLFYRPTSIDKPSLRPFQDGSGLCQVINKANSWTRFSRLVKMTIAGDSQVRSSWYFQSFLLLRQFSAIQTGFVDTWKFLKNCDPWWCTHRISAAGRWRHVHVSLSPTWAMWWDPVSKNKQAKRIPFLRLFSLNTQTST